MDVHKICGLSVDSILKTSALRKGCDNLTAVMIALENFESLISKPPKSTKTLLNEDLIEEVVLPPLEEEDDDKNIINIPNQLMLQKEAARSKNPKSIFLNKNDLFEETDGSSTSESSTGAGEPSLQKTNSFMMPKRNLLSEISEEDDASLISERGVNSPHRKSNAASNAQSSKLSKEQFIQMLN